jgi:hypothetical protein
VEAGLIAWALNASDGNKSRAADLLQIKRSTLGDRINRCRQAGALAADVERPRSARSGPGQPLQQTSEAVM